MLDQSHNVTDPIESLMSSAMELQRAFAQSLIVERSTLNECQEKNDVLGAAQTLKKAFITDVSPILARARAFASPSRPRWWVNAPQHCSSLTSTTSMP